MADMFAAVRVQAIKSINALQTIEAHGRREDKASAKRCDSTRTQLNLAESCVDDPLAVVAAFRKRKADTKASEYKNAPLGLHILCVVSPEFCKQGGDIHDPNNRMNQALFDEAKAWAEQKFGPGSVIARRMDMDEKGGGVVDLVVVPVHEVKQRGKVKNQVSVNKAYEKAFGGGRVYSKMQDSWAEHCQRTLDPALKRGMSKAETQREHVHSEIIGPALDKLNDVQKTQQAWQASAKKWRKTAENAEQRCKQYEAREAAYKQKIAEQEATISKHADKISRFKKGFFGTLAEAKAENLRQGIKAGVDDEMSRTREHVNDLAHERSKMLVENHKLMNENKQLAKSLKAETSKAEALDAALSGVVLRVPPSMQKQVGRYVKQQLANTPAASSDAHHFACQTAPAADVQDGDDEVTRNLKIAAAKDTARNNSGPHM